ncbi:MAG TPA: CdaR family protein [Symbiobacteriaceae bacterium]|nr:CdaR family protein [Symbiobacteriaceae bacterium]
MMERLLRHPTWLKIFSAALAILLWAMVIRQYTRDETKLLEVPLHVTYHPEFQLEDGPKDKERFVTVRVEGKNLLVTRLTAAQLNATVDYSKVTEPGRPQSLEIQVTGPTNLKGLTYTATPRTITATLVKNQEGLFPIAIEPATSVLVQDNREWLWTARPDRDRVSLSGSSVVLATVRVARVVLEAADLVPGKDRVTKKVIPTDEKGAPVNLKEQFVDVLLTWKEQPPGATFKVKPLTKGTLPPGLAVTGIDVQPASLQVRAAVLGGKLPEQAIIETEPIDLTGRAKTFSTTVRLLPPTGTTVTTNTVTATVNISEVLQERVIKGLPVTVRGKASNAEVTPTITDVQVRVRGLYSAVMPLEVIHIPAFVDVEGLGSGKHVLPVKVEAPVGVTVVDVDPPAIEVTIVAP